MAEEQKDMSQPETTEETKTAEQGTDKTAETGQVEKPQAGQLPAETKPAEPEHGEQKQAGQRPGVPHPQQRMPMERRPPRKGAAENVVLVGKKPTMSYVLAVVTQFSDGMNEIHIKARGRSISRAVDVAEVVKNRFVQGASTNVNIGTEEITDENNNKINVSTIDISLSK